MHAGHHDVQPAEQLVGLIEGAVVEDVHFDAGQDAKRRQFGVEPADQFQLLLQALGGQPAGHGQPRRVVGQGNPFVPEIAGGGRHLRRRAAAVRPVRVGVAVAAQRRPQRGGFRRGRLREHPGQVGGLLPGRGLGDHLGGDLADAGKGLQGAVADPLLQLARWQVAHNLGSPAERPHPVGRLGGPLQLERDLPQRVNCLHTQQIPGRLSAPEGRPAGGLPARGQNSAPRQPTARPAGGERPASPLALASATECHTCCVGCRHGLED